MHVAIKHSCCYCVFDLSQETSVNANAISSAPSQQRTFKKTLSISSNVMWVFVYAKCNIHIPLRMENYLYDSHKQKKKMNIFVSTAAGSSGFLNYTQENALLCMLKTFVLCIMFHLDGMTKGNLLSERNSPSTWPCVCSSDMSLSRRGRIT